ncbi:unnamed protein product [Taenia asiatica]|uniref:Fanconi-associated nuclease n=1 Tax=Taenia asiatica TaxID=60517 RepID=A0A0R3W7F9_TAEAS|nr:unnamed protein product [Taenia asiatica]
MELKADEGPAPLNDNADSLSDTTFGSSFRQHFLFAINHVFNEPCFAGLFIGEDADCIDKFAKLSDVDCFSDTELLCTLGRNELVNLAALFKLPSRGTDRRAIINALLKSSRHPSLLDFFVPTRSVKQSRLRALTERSLGPCFSVVKDYADVFSRVLLCFSLTSEKRSTSSYSGSFKSILAKDIFEIVQTRRGNITLPTYTISRKSLILRNKDELSKFFELCNLRHQLGYLTMKSNFAQAYEHFQQHLNHLTTVIENSTFQRSDLPRFLQRFTLPSLAIRLIRIGVNACERLRKYHEAVELILIVLSSDLLTSTSSRTMCFFIKRLLLDQGTHCGDPVACLKKIESLLLILRGLHPRHRLEIQTQIGRLTGEKSENESSNFWRDKNEDLRKSKRGENSSRKEWAMDSFVLDDIEALKNELLPRLKCAPVVKLSAPTPRSSTKLGARRPVYLWMGPEEDATKKALKTSIFQVENWALQHYLHNEKFEKGLHAESRICTTLFVLLFYDLLYGVDRADVFYSMLQTAPLDLFTGDFYISHRELVESRLEMISSAKRSLQTPGTELIVADPISQLLTDTWTKHKDERCIGVNWNLFPDGESDVVASDESVVLASICRLLISDYANWCSGLPDLTVWSPSSGKAKLVEVKGPSDQLSSQQVVWMDSLLSFGADVEICSVSGKLDLLPRICDHSSNTEDLISCFFYFSSSS